MLNLMEKTIRNKLEYYKQLKAVLEARQTKVASIHFRNNLLQKQKTANYLNEMDRIRGELSKTTLNHKSIEHFEKRKEELQKMINQIA
jgi:hypothetical protein